MDGRAQRGRGATIVETALVFVIAALVRWPGIAQELGGDELYNFLAARQLLVDGTLSIHGGDPYTRAELFTRIVAGFFRLFGESSAVARLPALLFGAAAAAIVFWWVASHGERLAAWVAALLLAFDPEAVKASQMCRFYTMHMVLFLGAAVAVEAAVRPGRRIGSALAFAAGAVLALRVGTEIQPVTKIGAGGLALFAGLACLPRVLAVMRSGRMAQLAVGAAVLGVLGVVALWAGHGGLDELIRLATYRDLWARGAAERPDFYVQALIEAYPTFATLLPVLVLLAAPRQPMLTLLCVCVFGASLVVHSAMAWKAQRYVLYLQPFFFVLSGLAVAAVVPALVQATDRFLLPHRWLAERPSSTRLVRAAVLAGVALFALAANPALARTVKSWTLDPSYRHPGMTTGTLSWARAAGALQPVLREAGAVVATDDLKSLYYLGRLDYVVNLDHLHEDRMPGQGPWAEFTPDAKLDVPVVSTSDSLRRIFACYAEGVVVAQHWALATDTVVPPETAKFLETCCESIELPREWGIAVWRWRTPASELARDCPPGPPHAVDP